jgi:hypothetical protein
MPMEFGGAIVATDQERGLRPSFSFAVCGACHMIDPEVHKVEVYKVEVHKVTWSQVGRVAEPGRYLFTFGWLTITPEDMAIWQQHPGAAFTLLIQSPTDGVEEYHLGAFELRGD